MTEQTKSTDLIDDDAKLVIRVVAMPADTNSSGDIFGGWLMSQMDLVAWVEARKHTAHRLATVPMDNAVFHRPIYVGDCLRCYAFQHNLVWQPAPLRTRTTYVDRAVPGRSDKSCDCRMCASRWRRMMEPRPNDGQRPHRRCRHTAEEPPEETRAMDTNLTAHYLAIETERAWLPEQAERGWLIEQAAVTQQGHIGPTAVRRWIGGLMIVAGQRLQGLPEPSIMTVDPAHAH